MRLITTLSDDAWQQWSVTLDDGSLATFEFQYLAGIQRWTFSLAHPKLILNDLMLTVHPNLLRSWRNLIPFGLACTSLDGVDPVDIADFAIGRIQIYMLNAAEIQQVEADILGVLV